MDDVGVNPDYIYPTHVGMNREHQENERQTGHLPHTCGDEPMMNPLGLAHKQSTPHIL